ncbi:MAG TPA: hypothetical protein VF905_03950 [Nitrospirota bacterium]
MSVKEENHEGVDCDLLSGGVKNKYGLVGGPAHRKPPAEDAQIICVLCDQPITRAPEGDTCGCAGPATLAEFLHAFADYPDRISIRVTREGDSIHVSLYEDPPEDGWENQGQLHRAAPGAIHWKLDVHECDKYQSTVRVSTGSGLDASISARLAMNMIASYKDRYREDAKP